MPLEASLLMGLALAAMWLWETVDYTELLFLAMCPKLRTYWSQVEWRLVPQTNMVCVRVNCVSGFDFCG